MAGFDLVRELWLRRTLRASKTAQGAPPLTYKAIEGTLENYRIYGDTVDGESVGDRTANLFDKNDPDILEDYEIQETNIVVRQKYFVTNFISVNAETSYITNRPDMNGFSSGVLEYDSSKQLIRRNPNSSFDGFTTTNTTAYIKLNGKIEYKDTCMLVKGNTVPSIYEPYGYEVPVTVEGKNLCNNIWEQGGIDANTGNVISHPNIVCCDFIPVKPDVTYSCSRTIANNFINLRCYGANKNYLGTGATLANKGNPLVYGDLFGTFMITDARVSYIRFNDYSNALDTKYMLVEGIYTAETMPPYEPYHAPITTPIYLPEQIKKVGDEAEYIDYAEQKQHRLRKNLLRNTAESQIQTGVTFTVNDDGGVTCNGTSTSRYYSLFRIPCYLVAGEYIISGCPVGGDSGTYRADIRISPNGIMIGSNVDIGVGATIVIDESGWYDYAIRIQGGYTVDDVVFKPMIRKADIEDDTYEPYIENTELDVTLPELPTLAGTNVLTVGTAVQPSKVEIKYRR